MGYWSSSSITVYGDAYVDFNEEVRDRKEDVIKLFTDEELNEEIEKREDGRSKYENRINKLKSYVYNIDVDVNSDDVLVGSYTGKYFIVCPECGYSVYNEWFKWKKVKNNK
jgi:predicted  nucleic acid-binding Zn-ribbon protein